MVKKMKILPRLLHKLYVNGVILTLQKRYFLDVLDHLYCVSHTSAFYHIYSSRGRKTHNGNIQILRNIDFYPFEPHQPSL